jgi:hypothetical protein
MIWMLALSFVLVVPLSVNAGLVPCGNEGQSSCTICDLIAGIHGIVQFIVGLVAISGVVVITVAGVAYIVSAGNTGITSWAKSAVKNTLIGVAVILLAFMMITFIINRVLQGQSGVQRGGIGNIASDAWTINCSVTPSSVKKP